MISVFVLSHNRCDDLRGNLLGLLGDLGLGIELIAVDNASTDGSVSFFESCKLIILRLSWC